MAHFLLTILFIFLSWCCTYGQISLEDFSNKEKKRFNKIRSSLNKIPNHQTNSVMALSGELKKITITDLEKAYAVFYWISDHVTYDMKSFLANKTPPYQPKEVLKTRLAVCSGYAYLFKALCDQLGVNSKVLHGYSKGYGYDPSQSFEVSNHSWNSVYINDRWYLLDATWAASTSNNYSTSTNVNINYFLTHPKKFIKDHLPEDPKWQLLSPQISLADFEEDISLLNTTKYTLVVNDDIENIENYVDIGTREVALQKRIIAYNPKNTNAVYKLGVALLYQALDTMNTMHQLSYENVLLATPKYKYRIYELLDKAATSFKRVPEGPTYQSAQTFLSEVIYQKGVFNYEVAQIIYDTTLPLTKEQYELIKADFGEARTAYYQIALEYFKSIPPSSWYYDNSQSYLRAIMEEQQDIVNSLN